MPQTQDTPPQNHEDKVSVRTLVVAIFVTIVISILFLEQAGMLRHSLDKDARPLSQYQVVYLKPGDDFRMSHKASNQTAYCADGYVVIAADDNPALRGVLVDYKNRGVRCADLR